MITSTTSWEKMRPRLYKNGDLLIVREIRSLDSIFTPILGAAFLFLGLYQGIPAYINGSLFTSVNLPWNLLTFVFVALGLGLIYKGKVTRDTRNEQQGIHPNDTLTIFDKNRKTVTKQTGTTKEEQLATFNNMKLELGFNHDSDLPTIHVILKHAKGEEILLPASTKFEGERILKEMKDFLNVS